MALKESFQAGGKNRKGISHSGHSANHQTEVLLKEVKEKAGDVILVAITARTMIELPASLTPEEREARIANYKKLHTSKI